jgi:hypothetical protein
MSETIAQNRVFIYDPHLVPQIAQLVSYDNRVPIVSRKSKMYRVTCVLILFLYRIFKHMHYTPWMVLQGIEQKLQKFYLLSTLLLIMVFYYIFYDN